MNADDLVFATSSELSVFLSIDVIAVKSLGRTAPPTRQRAFETISIVTSASVISVHCAHRRLQVRKNTLKCDVGGPVSRL